MRKIIYLISPDNINFRFYISLDKVLSFGNVKFFQLRTKNIKKDKLFKIIKKLKKITKKHKVIFILNDDYKYAFKIKADGCHMGQSDGSLKDARKIFDGIIINAAGFTHTSVAIRDALDIFKKPIIELHISNIYKREEFRQKSLISDIVTGGIFGLGSEGYILAIISLEKMLKNEN